MSRWLFSTLVLAATPALAGSGGTLRVLCLQHDATLPHTTLAVYKLDQEPDHAMDGRYRVDVTIDDAHASHTDELAGAGALGSLSLDRGKLSVQQLFADMDPGFLSTGVEVATLTLDGKDTKLTCQDDPSVIDWGANEGWHRILLASPTLDAKGMEAGLVAQGVHLVTSVKETTGAGPGTPVDATHERLPVTLAVNYAKLIPAAGDQAAHFDYWTMKAEGDAVFEIQHVDGTDLIRWSEAPVFRRMSMIH